MTLEVIQQAARIRMCLSTAGACSKREVGKNDDERQQSESRHSHQAGVSDVSRSLRFDAGDGSTSGDKYC